MDCIECKVPNPDDNRYCGKCGAELGRTLDETIRKKNFRDRQATEMEITDAVAGRLMRWGGWLSTVAALILAAFGIALGLVYHDMRATMDAAKAQIARAVTDGKNNLDTAVSGAMKDIGNVKEKTGALAKDVEQIQSDTKKYGQVNDSISKLQQQITSVKGQVVDLGNKGLIASNLTAMNTLRLGGKGAWLQSFANIGCPPVGSVEQEWKWSLCFRGERAELSIMTHTGLYRGVRPVSSFSTIGFQDTSSTPKPTCNMDSRGTFYVEKGAGNVADKPLLCAKQADGKYEWIQLGVK
jgi:hypothetical protein